MMTRKNPISKLKDAVIAVTYRCNSRCISCNICRNLPPEELPAAFYRGLPPGLENIGITGGEPTLREDLTDLIGIIRARCRKAKLTLSTNGLLLGKIRGELKEIYKIDRNIGIAVSIDGIGPVHDKVRGVPGSFPLAVEGIKILRETGFRDLRVSFSICDENADQISRVYRLARSLKAAFTLGLAQNSSNYFRKTDNLFTRGDLLKEGVNYVMRRELNSFNPKKWFMSYYDYGLYWLYSRGKRLLKCDALEGSLFIDPSGDIYPCIFSTDKAGSLKDWGRDFAGFWSSGEAVRAREKARRCGRSCWQLCTARTPILNNILPVSLWVLKKKILSLVKPEIL